MVTRLAIAALLLAFATPVMASEESTPTSPRDCAVYQALLNSFPTPSLQAIYYIPPKDMAAVQSEAARLTFRPNDWSMRVSPPVAARRQPDSFRPAGLGDPAAFDAAIIRAQAGGDLACALKSQAGGGPRRQAHPKGSFRSFSRISWNDDRTSGLVFVQTVRASGFMVVQPGTRQSARKIMDVSEAVVLCAITAADGVAQSISCQKWLGF